METGSCTKIVDCVLGLKEYYERTQKKEGNGSSKYNLRSPMSVRSNGRNPKDALFVDPNTQMDVSTHCEKQSPTQPDARINEGCHRQRIGRLVALKDEDQDSWQQFKKLNDRVFPLSTFSDAIVEARKRPIRLEHPIVKIAGDFAINVFNESYKMHAKEQHDILHEYEIMECKFLKVTRRYYFYVTIEAIEQGNLGVYEAKVEFESDDGRMTLLMFLSTDRAPVGKKAMEMADLTRMRSFYECAEGLKKDIHIHLETSNMSLKGKKQGKVASELSRLRLRRNKVVYLLQKGTRMSRTCGKKKAKMEAGLCCRRTKAVYLLKKGTRMSQACGKNKVKVTAELIRLKKDLDKASKVGLRKVLYQDIEPFFPPACQKTNQDVDEDVEYSSDLEDDDYSGMVRREDGTTSGYDYYNPFVGGKMALPVVYDGLNLGFLW